MWDPANLTISDISPTAASNDEQNLRLTINGTGFPLAEEMHGLLVRTVSQPARMDVIPCNSIKVTSGDTQLTCRVCTKGKQQGKYDLIWWTDPPESVVDDKGTKVPGVPVNDVFVLQGALTLKSSAG